jgi:hypothetical protein
MYSGGAYDTFLPRLLAFTPFTTSDAAGCESNVSLILLAVCSCALGTSGGLSLLWTAMTLVISTFGNESPSTLARFQPPDVE